MTLEEGNIVEGKVINITNFGAFVEIEGKTGLVHISEVADSYVKDIKDYVDQGDQVMVKILPVDDNGKISLSMKQAGSEAPKKSTKPVEIDWSKENKPESDNFEDIMSKFMKESEEIMSDYKKKQEVRTKSKRN